MHTLLKNQMSSKTQQQVSIFFAFPPKSCATLLPHPHLQELRARSSTVGAHWKVFMAETGEKRANCLLELPMCNSALEKGSASGEAQGLMKEGQAVYPFKIYEK